MFSPYVIFHGKWWKCEVPLSKFCLRSCCPFPTTICNTFWECGELFLHHWLCCLHFSSRNIKFSKRISVTNTKRGQTNQATLKGIWEKWWAMEKKDKKDRWTVSIFSNSLHSGRQKNYQGLWRQRNLGLFPAPPTT